MTSGYCILDERRIDKAVTNESPKQRVQVVDVKMPFVSMVVFMVKWAIASIPAVIILVVLTATFWVMALGFITSLFRPTHELSSATPAALSKPSPASSTASRESAATQQERAYLGQVLVRNVKVAEGYSGLGVVGEIKNFWGSNPQRRSRSQSIAWIKPAKRFSRRLTTLFSNRPLIPTRAPL